jgi:two-component system, NtrC family, nitrogen regulation sensor histidine kinase GlnL
MNPRFSGLELLVTATVILDAGHVIRYVNPAAENLLETGASRLIGRELNPLFTEPEVLRSVLDEAMGTHWDYSARNLSYPRDGREPLPISCLVARVDLPEPALLVELRPLDQQMRVAREERLVSEQEAHRELIRNLAHEIKNPLGGLRGSAQLLEGELDRAELREYTQVIIKEADRLQALMDRLLTPHRTPRVAPVNMHGVLERVRSLVLAEFSQQLAIRRDYDPSIPEIIGDQEQLIQVVLNVARNAAQAIQSAQASSPEGNAAKPANRGTIAFRTRAIRQATIQRTRHRLALDLQVIDDGPGIPEAIRDRVFSPLVSGRDGGSGVGLSLAHAFVQFHKGMIEFESRAGRTVFHIRLPIV